MVKTINQSYKEKYQHEKKRKIFRKVFLFLVLLFGLTGGMVYGFFFSGFFSIREISISTEGGILLSEDRDIRSLVDSYLSEKKFFISRFNNIFLADSDKISAIIGQEFPAVENIKVEKKYFHALEISLNQKEAVGIWCYKKTGQCFYFDRQGIAFDSVTETRGALLVNVDDERGTFENLGQQVTNRELLNLIFEVRERLKKIKIEALKFIVSAGEDFRIEVKTAEGWEIYFSTKDDLDRQLANLEVFLSQKVTREKRIQLQYIDLTVPNRVYYK